MKLKKASKYSASILKKRLFTLGKPQVKSSRQNLPVSHGSNNNFLGKRLEAGRLLVFSD